jgi:hypothetical protein
LLLRKLLITILIVLIAVLTIMTGMVLAGIKAEPKEQLAAASAAEDIESHEASLSEQDREKLMLIEKGQAYSEKIKAEQQAVQWDYEAIEEPHKLKARQRELERAEAVQKAIAALEEKEEANQAEAGSKTGWAARKQQNKTWVAGFSTMASAATELLDWWEEADKLFVKNVPVTITDVESGKSFRAVRSYGSSHADMETLTAEDTAIMLEIWGGEWNWQRRAITVEINGRKLAASASGMPHAGLDSLPEGQWVDNRSGGYGTGTNLDKVKGNNMDGHFDIHFLNSRTHGTDRVDEMHQLRVQEALAKK